MNSYDGNGDYIAFSGGGGGGGGYTPPVTPNPTYVPTQYSNDIFQNSITINLSSDSGEVEFLENGINKGYGLNTTIRYSPSSTFNGVKRYQVVKNAAIANQYYEVEVTKTYQPQIYDYYTYTSPIYGNNYGYNRDMYGYNYNSYGNGYGYNYTYNLNPNITAIDYNYSEILTLREYALQTDGTYSLSDTRTFNFGSISLNFTLKYNATDIETPIDVIDPPNDTPVEYDILFSSNFKEELANNVKLSYTLFTNDGEIALSNSITLADANSIGEILQSKLNGRIDFKIEYINKPANYTLTNIYQTSNALNLVGQSEFDFSKWNVQNSSFSVSSKDIVGGLSVVVLFEKEVDAPLPKITLSETQYNVSIKDSDLDKISRIPFRTENAETVFVYMDGKENPFSTPASNGYIDLSFNTDFDGVYGTKKVVLVAASSKYGTGERQTILITYTAINDFPSITSIEYVESIEIPSFSDLNIDLTYVYNSFATSTVDVDLRQKNGEIISLFKNLSPNGDIKINLKNLRERYPNWNGSETLSLIFKPFNRGGAEELVGNTYEVNTTLLYPSIIIDEDIFTSALFGAFNEKLNIVEPEPDSKYLTHIANFGNDEQILISTWEEDNWTLSEKLEDNLGNIVLGEVVESTILKLYSPLPSNIGNNSTFWITKLMANPLVETVVLTEKDDLKCPPLKGPNFNIDVDYVKGKSTSFESLDNLILNASASSSSDLVSKYLSGSLGDTVDLNIEYTDGSDYLWGNFVHFSSAKERVDNFVYKVQLIEAYDKLIQSASIDTGYQSFASDFTASIASQQEVERQTTKKNQLVNGFDGFEKFLYTSSSLSWPYTGNTINSSDSNEVESWYNDIIELANDYDNNNQNYILNNIPQYILNNENNDSLLLFYTMVGQHFDTIYFYTKSIEKSRGLGYKATGGISNKLLYDTLSSFGWDAKNLASNEQLWKYVFGQDIDGNVVNEKSPKDRTYEVWRRIINNLPYLLKHKGTRRGIYALLSCYGIPSSNLSILEFGGPEVTNETSNKSKFVFDNITTALKMELTSSIEVDWRNTDKNIKPNTIELFVKPNKFNERQTLISGSGWSLQLSGSADSNYGIAAFNYSGSTAISSSLLPIFNGKFFGISLSSGSNGLKLDIRQADKERTIFQQSLSGSYSTNWNSGSTIRIGTYFTGSVDEFRLWSEVLDTERFYEHVSFPEMINGNHTSSSTDDLYFRLDFEYPKNLAESSSLLNVDTNIYFSSSLYRNDLESGSLSVGTLIFSENPSASYSASAFGFTSISDYPYQFEAIDRSVVLEIPNVGSSRYSTNKVRFESQELISDLSSKGRATKKAFDQSPTDSNRVGLFFSPTKELNLDIAKSFGGINLDNYIGAPADRYNASYKSLDKLRNYYFQRFDGRDIYAYINLIKLYEKSMFEDIKKMLPARVKATTGLLIEPHFLERSKVQHKKPTGEHNNYTSSISYGSNILSAENQQNEVTIHTENEYTLNGLNNQYDALIATASANTLTGDNFQYNSVIDYMDNSGIVGEYNYYSTNIDAGLGEPTILTEIDLVNSNIVVGQSDLEKIGFGIYAQSGSAIRTYYNKDGKKIKERIRVDLVKEEKTKFFTKPLSLVNGYEDKRGSYELTSSVYYETKLNIRPFTTDNLNISGDIVEIKPLNGYLSVHYKNTSDLTRGLQNSYYKGSKNTAATTLDGTPPVEIFTTNPNTLRVNKAGRDASEPILEVE